MRWRLWARRVPDLSPISTGWREGTATRFSLCCIFDLPMVDILCCLFQLQGSVRTWLLIKLAKLILAQMIPGSEPWFFANNIVPLHPVVFWEAWIDTFHNVEHEGTGSPGSSTIKGPFPGCHIILNVLKNGAKEYPHRLGPGSHIGNPNFFGGRQQRELTPGLQRTGVWGQQSSRDLRDWMGAQLVVLFHPISNGQHFASQVHILIQMEKPESSNFLVISVRLPL